MIVVDLFMDLLNFMRISVSLLLSQQLTIRGRLLVSIRLVLVASGQRLLILKLILLLLWSILIV